MKVGLREANQNFAKVIRSVRAGRQVTLTDRGRPIAVIRPVAAVDDEESRLQALEEEGLIRRAEKPGPMPWGSWKPIRVQGEPFSETVSRMRDERV